MASTGQKRPEEPQSSPELLKELQAEVSEEAAPLMQFIVNNAALIMVSVGLFAIVLAGVGGYHWYSAQKIEKVQNELSSIVMMNDAQQRFTELQKFLTVVPAEVRIATLLELATVAISLEKYDVAVESYAEIAKVDANNPLSQVAMLNQAELLLRLGKAVEALIVLEKLEMETIPESKNAVRSILAEAAILANKPERALKAFEELAVSSTGAEADFFRYRIKTLKDAQNNKDGQGNKDASTSEDIKENVEKQESEDAPKK